MKKLYNFVNYLLLGSIYGVIALSLIGMLCLWLGVTEDESKGLLIMCLYLIGVALVSSIALLMITYYNARPKKRPSFNENKYKSTLKEKL